MWNNAMRAMAIAVSGSMAAACHAGFSPCDLDLNGDLVVNGADFLAWYAEEAKRVTGAVLPSSSRVVSEISRRPS